MNVSSFRVDFAVTRAWPSMEKGHGAHFRLRLQDLEKTQEVSALG